MRQEKIYLTGAKMDKIIFINGRFLTNKITGIERYSLEVTKALSKIPGITPLEALKAGCKKLYLSDIPVFREVYGDVAEFFDPRDYVCTVHLGSESETWGVPM